MQVSGTGVFSKIACGTAIVSIFVLTGCAGENGAQRSNLFNRSKSADVTASPAAGSDNIRLVERDVEVPEAFEVETEALWDGRPSLGGVWVAHPASDQPERVIIRNSTNGQFVIGALFRRERNNPGPEFQLSSDAAAALDVLAGRPTMLRVTALRRETVNADELQPTSETAFADASSDGFDQQIDTTDIASTALDTLDQAPRQQPAATQVASAAPAPVAAPASDLSRPYVQIGFFSKRTNADNNLAALKSAGIPSRLIESQVNGTPHWRVVAGPASNAGSRRQLQSSVKKLGYQDAYFVTE